MSVIKGDVSRSMGMLLMSPRTFRSHITVAKPTNPTTIANPIIACRTRLPFADEWPSPFDSNARFLLAATFEPPALPECNCVIRGDFMVVACLLDDCFFDCLMVLEDLEVCASFWDLEDV